MDALRLEAKGLFNTESLLAKATAAREAREAAGLGCSRGGAAADAPGV